ncbi:DNA polymerase III subunit beta [Kiloniella litopenaei]|uniref:Beta sliding clamp n=1 Tax=Kiloniella litopenaei TaxID=1549748 RepID=A0A0M2R905_9PROT|nr:DNA polymerase III subunit beta [Kiloniella litopenaei]KKJ76063.1 DNA polymerase III subunit beta [Kiloniella litopenaei]
MKLTIERSALLKSLAHVQSVVERRNTIPILSNVLMEAKDGKLSLTATDMDLTIVDQVEATIVDAGVTTAPAHTFYDIVRKLPDGSEVELTANAETAQMTLKAGRSTFTLQTLPREDFPAAGVADLPQVFGIQAGELKNLIDRTRFAISTEETRYYLNGIYVHATEAEGIPVLRAVATDGHRLARFEMPLPQGAENLPGVIVPRKTVNELRKLIDETNDPIEVSLSETKIMFRFDSTVLSSKLIDGTFPDYQRVIPSGNDKSLVLDCKTFSAAVDRVSTISTEKSRAVKITLDGSALTLSATSAENGSAVEVLEVNYEGTSLDIGFNSRYLLDIAQQIEGDSAEFLMADAASPTIVRDSADTSALYVLMPMRV